MKNSDFNVVKKTGLLYYQYGAECCGVSVPELKGNTPEGGKDEH